MAADNYVKMANGDLNGAMAFMKGQLKVTGNVLLAQKMQAIFPQGK
jgi:putative sterol carrier protein